MQVYSEIDVRINGQQKKSVVRLGRDLGGPGPAAQPPAGALLALSPEGRRGGRTAGRGERAQPHFTEASVFMSDPPESLITV